jgi:hypothetical protein
MSERTRKARWKDTHTIPSIDLATIGLASTCPYCAVLIALILLCSRPFWFRGRHAFFGVSFDLFAFYFLGAFWAHGE